MKIKRIVIVFLMMIIISGMSNIKVSNANTKHYEAFYREKINKGYGF